MEIPKELFLDPTPQDGPHVLAGGGGRFVLASQRSRERDPLFAAGACLEGELRGDAAYDLIQEVISSSPARFSSVFWPDAERRERDYQIFAQFLDECGDLARLRYER